MAKKEITKRKENGIRARIQKIVAIHGFEEFRLIANRYIEEVREKKKLVIDIERKKRELAEMEAKK